MIYRKKTYKINANRIDEFNALFNEYLLPTQLKYGARLVGRWMTDEEDNTIEVFAIWEYIDRDEYERIESKVRGDTEHVERVKKQHNELRKRGNDILKDAPNEEFITSTVPREKTILS